HRAAQALSRTVGTRLAVVWGVARRAWRRSLQLRMVLITLLASGVLVGAFGTLVASRITAGVINTKVKTALHQVEDSARSAAPQLGAVTDAADISLPGQVRLVGQALQPTPTTPDSQVILAILPANPHIPDGVKFVAPFLNK